MIMMEPRCSPLVIHTKAIEGIIMMKIDTAIRILEKERAFLGVGFLELLQDVQRYGRMVYSEKVMEAFDRFMVDGQKLFAVAE
jgi:hypothetical protein